MISQATFSQAFFTLFAEAFGVAGDRAGFFLDDGKSGLLGTIDQLSADQASAGRTAEESTIAAHCGHVLFLLEFFAAFQRGETPNEDWASSWRTHVVNEAEWADLRAKIRSTYDFIVTGLQSSDEWPEPAIGASMMLLAHCSYHLGEIRQRVLWV